MREVPPEYSSCAFPITPPPYAVLFCVFIKLLVYIRSAVVLNDPGSRIWVCMLNYSRGFPVVFLLFQMNINHEFNCSNGYITLFSRPLLCFKANDPTLSLQKRTRILGV